MRRRLLPLLLLAAFARPAFAGDTAYAKRCLEKVENDLAQVQAHPEATQWWSQCQIDLGDLKDAAVKLAPEDRTPFDAKVALYTPQVEAGVKLDRAMHVVRHIQDALDDAREDLKNGALSDAVRDRLERYFAEPDAQAIPADVMKKLQGDYAAVKAGRK